MGDNIARPEYWVMRLWYRQDDDGRPWPVTLDDCTPATQVAIYAMLATGKLAILPNGIIGEPVEVWDSPTQAHVHRQRLASAHPRERFEVVLNVEIPV